MTESSKRPAIAPSTVFPIRILDPRVAASLGLEFVMPLRQGIGRGVAAAV